MSDTAITSSNADLELNGVRLAGHPPTELFNIKILDNKIHSITTQPTPPASPSPSLLLPSLCHPHIHLDKAFLLTSNHTDRYHDLAPTTGTFREALSNTSSAKARYEIPDLTLRGAQLIAESVQAGVTSMRAFVEVDHTVGTKCIEAAVALKKKFEKDCFVQICAFAQDPIFSGEHDYQNRSLLEKALAEYKDEIDVLGTTPYVESDHKTAIRNIEWAVHAALQRNIHLDFHLDYNLEEEQPAAVWDVVRVLSKTEWPHKTAKTVVLGHGTRLTLFPDPALKRLALEIRRGEFPISFVGLPTSDLYMMGRPGEGGESSGQRPRGTLQIPMLVREPYYFSCAMGINNVGNAFTPWGSVDPLRLASLGVGIYHAGTTADAELLYECVSVRARRAIGLDTVERLEAREGDSVGAGEWLVFENDNSEMKMPGSGETVPRRMRRTVQDVVWDPPGVEGRSILRLK
jgi:cytosine/adenosine deaminase-related metal-dependent hydrolase